MKEKKHFRSLGLLGSLMLLSTLSLPSLASNQYLEGKYINVASNRGGSFIFNPRTHSWTAVNGQGRVIRSGRASGGQSYCPDIGRSCRTPTGTFYVHSKGGAGCKSTRYPVGRGGAPMPYCMFFTQFYAVHGSYEVPRGRNASHGCIRVTPSDALWLTRNFMRVGTRVVVKSY